MLSSYIVCLFSIACCYHHLTSPDHSPIVYRRQAQYGVGVVQSMKDGGKSCKVLSPGATPPTSRSHKATNLVAHPLKDGKKPIVPDPAKHIGFKVVVLNGVYVQKPHPTHQNPTHVFGIIESFSKDGLSVNVRMLHNDPPRGQQSEPQQQNEPREAINMEHVKKEAIIRLSREVLHVLEAAPPEGPSETLAQVHMVEVPLNTIAAWVANFKKQHQIDLRLVRGSASDVEHKLCGATVDQSWRVDFKCFRSGIPQFGASFTSTDRMSKDEATFIKGVGCKWAMTIRYMAQPTGEKMVTVTYDKCHNNHILGSPQDLRLLDPDNNLKCPAMDLIAAGMRPTLILHKLDCYVDYLATVLDSHNSQLYSFESRRLRWTQETVYNLRNTFLKERQIHADDGVALEHYIKVSYIYFAEGL